MEELIFTSNCWQKNLSKQMETIQKKGKEGLSLPKINQKKHQISSKTTTQSAQDIFILKNDIEEVSQLEDWSNSVPTIKRKKNPTGQSIVFLYKNNNKYNARNSSRHRNQSQEMQTIALSLAQLDTELIKIRKINYETIYQNIQYCKGMYQNAFNTLLKGVDKHHDYVDRIVHQLKDDIVTLRERHLHCVTQLTQKRKEKDINTATSVQLAEKSMNVVPIPTIIVKDKANLKNNQRNRRRASNFSNLAEKEPAQYRDQNIVSTSSAMNSSMVKASFLQEYQDLHSTMASLRDQIESNEVQLKTHKRMLIRIEQARCKILKFSLEMGYDIREEGLVWILKQLNRSDERLHKKLETGLVETKPKENSHEENTPSDDKKKLNDTFLTQKSNKPSPTVNGSQQKKPSVHQRQIRQCSIIPKYSEFPTFLTEQEIYFIICKLKNDFKLQKLEEEKDKKSQEEKVIIKQAYENVQRSKNRKLSMIKERELAEKLNTERRTERINGHKYLSPDTLRIVEQNEHTKATKYELIYKETIKKLNRLCIQEIYGKKSKAGQQGSMIRTDKIMEEVKKMLSDATKLKEEQQNIKTQEEKQLSEILRKLRGQKYSKNRLDQRNPISVIGCLVGWKKAKKILENEMNMSLASSY